MSGEFFLLRRRGPDVEATIIGGVDPVPTPTEQHGHHIPLDIDCFIVRKGVS